MCLACVQKQKTLVCVCGGVCNDVFQIERGRHSNSLGINDENLKITQKNKRYTNVSKCIHEFELFLNACVSPCQTRMIRHCATRIRSGLDMRVRDRASVVRKSA